MKPRPSTYEFFEGGQPRWILAYSPAHAQACAAARGWELEGGCVHGPFWTAVLVSEWDVDMVLDVRGRVINDFSLLGARA